MQIEEFAESDQPAVIALWRRCNLLRPWNDPEKDIARKLKVQREMFLVGKIDAHVVATVMGGYDGHRGWVNYLAVDPPHQRRGLARAMMDEVTRRLTALGCPKINLQVRDDNLEAIEFYEAIGFARDRAISMGKRLIAD
ncbi:MAG TPA: GNAT family acetyltransferase [Gemmatimonadaceae bacterium]|nr:GNAT family acetyltransferase [Gemmatimonadaceae bacterium]